MKNPVFLLGKEPFSKISMVEDLFDSIAASLSDAADDFGGKSD